jgi:FkbM family methyltransferase
MHYDFIEIGSHYQCTLLEFAPDNHVGLTIEPIGEYLFRLPNRCNVTKLAAAIVADESVKEMDLYYVTERDIQRKGLHKWISQCNQLGSYHPWHLNYYRKPDVKVNPISLVQMGIVKTRKVPCMTFNQLVQKFKIETVDYIKIDAEGYDCKIVNGILDSEIRPKKIQFETHGGWGTEEIDQVRSRLTSVGYQNEITPTDTISIFGS